MTAEPSIQYARTSDGVNVAFFAMGDGPPVLQVPPIPWSNLRSELEDPGHRSWYDRASANKRIIRYDNRGSGLSDRDAPTFDQEAFLLDIDAVADKLGFERFVLYGVVPGAPVAVSYAINRPDRVSHLVLWCPVYRTGPRASAEWATMNSLREKNWEVFTETAAHAMIAGWSAGEPARQYAAHMRASVEQRAPVLSCIDEIANHEDNLRGIQCPTLVVQRAEAQTSMESARYLAANIPNAEFVIVEGSALLPWVGDLEPLMKAVDRFLGIETPEKPAITAAQTEVSSGSLATILFTDIEGSTMMTQQQGDQAAQSVVRAHNTVVRAALSRYGGAETKHTGDGIMASFPLASSAIDAAIAIQQGVAAAPVEFRVRIGLNAGEPVVEESDLFGTAVQLARRVCDNAEAGTILVTDVVRQLAAGKGFLFSDQGVAPLKGFEDPVRLYQVRWQEGQVG